jgi:AhpD family alkylhydroperoxidase
MSTNFPALRNELQSVMLQLGREIPEAMGGFAALHKAATAKGALERKTKELIALGIAISIRCDSCIAHHVRDVLAAGATHAEVLECLGVAVMMGGGSAAMYACTALTALQQFESERR